jgi:hypothetical protein
MKTKIPVSENWMIIVLSVSCPFSMASIPWEMILGITRFRPLLSNANIIRSVISPLYGFTSPINPGGLLRAWSFPLAFFMRELVWKRKMVPKFANFYENVEFQGCQMMYRVGKMTSPVSKIQYNLSLTLHEISHYRSENRWRSPAPDG